MTGQTTTRTFRQECVHLPRKIGWIRGHNKVKPRQSVWASDSVGNGCEKVRIDCFIYTMTNGCDVLQQLLRCETKWLKRGERGKKRLVLVRWHKLWRFRPWQHSKWGDLIGLETYSGIYIHIEKERVVSLCTYDVDKVTMLVFVDCCLLALNVFLRAPLASITFFGFPAHRRTSIAASLVVW